jgi:carboxyl-terminal processing protease
VKNRFSLALIALIILALSAPAFVLAQQTRTQPIPPVGSRTNGKSDPPASTNGRRPRTRGSSATAAVKEDFNEALEIIRQNYIDGNKLDYNNTFKSSIIGMLRTLDPHSNYFDKEEFDEMKTDQRSEYYGIGASIQNYVIGDQLETYVTGTFESAPAFRAGLRYGDRIDAVDGVPMHAKSSAEVRDKIRGPRGSLVKITLTHAATGQTDVVEITRDAVPQPSVPDYYLIRPGVGFIDMTRGFNYDTTVGLQHALDVLHGQGMNALVLDLRNNPGGFLDQAIRVANTFLPSAQPILTQKGRDGFNNHTYYSENDTPDRTPLVILVNDFTASASEIVAGAMQDHDRALIVGQTSFGKGLVQSIINLPEGAGLTLTSAKYYTPSGRLIQRDYSDGGFYNYIYKGGTLRDPSQPRQPNGPASRTDTGRVVYGGGGITPDEPVEPAKITAVQDRLRMPVFFFVREAANGRIAGLDKYKVGRAIEFNHNVERTDFPITDAVFAALREYVSKEAAWKMLVPQLDRNRSFIESQLRFQFATAAFGTVKSLQVLTREDPQVAKAADITPRARDLAQAAMRARLQQP